MILVPSKNVLRLWQFTAAIIIAALFSLFCYIPTLSDKARLIAAAVSAAVLCLVLFLYQPLLFKAQKISVTDHFLSVEKGVIFKREYLFPNKNTVYIKYYLLPLHSCFGLYVAVVKGIGSSLLLPPLTEKQAVLLKEAMQNGE